ncbi:type II toxin-antitoxin system TacA family antitoxin [Methylocaldum gracile]|uniref:type II toxin-antitoxin system TacA family antitoxin n=1 Tax=unclassified Methylocaldum TaxID=2622260 RepID=UPI0010EFD6EF
MPVATTPYERIDLRTSPEIKALIVRAAATAGVSVSAFVLGAAQERAKQVISEAELMTLSPHDWEAFVTALDHTDKPRPKLSAAMQRHREWQSERESS